MDRCPSCGSLGRVRWTLVNRVEVGALLTIALVSSVACAVALLFALHAFTIVLGHGMSDEAEWWDWHFRPAKWLVPITAAAWIALFWTTHAITRRSFCAECGVRIRDAR